MARISLCFLGVSVSLWFFFWPTPLPGTAADELPQPHRSPVDLAVVPGGRYALTANPTSDSVSLVDLQDGKVLHELACGRRPAAVACSRDGRRAAVSNLWSDTITLLELHGPTLKPLSEVRAGPSPRGLAFAPDGRSLYAAVAGRDEVVQLDWPGGDVVRRWPAPREPRQLTLSADGAWLAAASSRSGQVRCWETSAGKLSWERHIEDGFNLRGLTFTPDGRDVLAAHVVHREFPVSKQNIEQGWVTDSRLTRFALRADAPPFARQLALDQSGKAVGDPYGLAFSPDGRTLAVTGSGSHEVVVLEASAIPWNAGDPGDFLDASVAKDRRKFRRVALGGRPLTVAFRENTGEAVVANYLLDAVQIVDTTGGKLLRTIPLGSPPSPSLARRGEALFYDAGRSHHQWFSCNTCHVEGHTCGLTFDTLNDDSYGNPKLTPTLRNVSHTGPWTWHGWQKDLGAAVEKSVTETMFGAKPSPEEKEAFVAFLRTLRHPPDPYRAALGEAGRRGEAIFHGKAKCARCHHGEDYTSASNYDVGLEPDGSPYPRWNPPSLRGLADRGPYLHDGRAATLEDLLEKYHAPEKLGGQALTAEERQDLCAFLKSL